MRVHGQGHSMSCHGYADNVAALVCPESHGHLKYCDATTRNAMYGHAMQYNALCCHASECKSCVAWLCSCVVYLYSLPLFDVLNVLSCIDTAPWYAVFVRCSFTVACFLLCLPHQASAMCTCAHSPNRLVCTAPVQRQSLRRLAELVDQAHRLHPLSRRWLAAVPLHEPLSVRVRGIPKHPESFLRD